MSSLEKDSRQGMPRPRSSWMLGAACVVVGAGIGIVATVFALMPSRENSAAPVVHATNASAAAPSTADETPLGILAALLQESLKTSRPLLLGSRNADGPSCVTITHTGDVQGVMPQNPGDLDGGPGTSMAMLFFFERQGFKACSQDYKWQQSRLRTYLANNLVMNESAEKIAHESAERAYQFWQTVENWTAVPNDIAPIRFDHKEDWPSYCLTSLNDALRAKDLVQTKRWANELAASTFWLEDLLRWRGFLYTNHLAALDFQARCESLFTGADQMFIDYDPQSTLSQFPAGVLGLNGNGNYYEVERQAERMFSMPADRLAEIAANKNPAPNSIWMVPASRPAFMKLRAVLSADNQATWDLAARTPYEHSYLTNMLFRARTTNLLDDLAAVLKKFNARNPHAKIGELMNVMMYRGHSFAGVEWGDRFQPQLTEAADAIGESESDLDALQNAWAWTNKFYTAPAQYGVTFTLRDALAEKRLDCVRATDMIAAIFRNAGRARMGHVRWCAENGGHSVAAFFPSSDTSKPVLVDGLTAPHEPEQWPDCYFHGHEWPAGFEKNKPPYCMEFYVRGIDSYVWAQGYIARGPNAGNLVSTTIPWSTRYQHDSVEKVFDGPYPQ